MKFSIEQYQEALDRLDGGLLFGGSHPPNEPKFCALELDTVMRSLGKADSPIYLPDLRPLNDAPWLSDKARTKAMLPVMASLSDWSLWTEDRQRRWASRVVVETVRQIIAELPVLPDAIRDQCRAVNDLSSAAEAASAARAAAWAASAARAAAAWAAARAAWAAAAAGEAAWAAAWAASAARAAAAAAAAAAWAASAARAAWAAAAAREAAWAEAGDKTLKTTCRIWIEAAEVEQ